MSTLTLEGLTALLSGVGAGPIPSIPGDAPVAHPLNRPIGIYRACLADILARLAGCETAVTYESLQTPGTLANGDLVLPVPRLRIKGKTPAEQCAELEAAFPNNHPLFQKPVAAGIHLPFFFTPLSLPRLVLPYIFQRQQCYGNHVHVGLRNIESPDQGRKKVILEFSSPNIAKEFHAGHLRSTIIGAFIANLYETMGWDVVKVNYLGDWGKQFGLLAVGWQRFGSEEELAREPLKHLLDVYARINAVFKPEQEASKKARDEGRDTAEIESQGLFAERNAFFSHMESGDEEAIALWRRFRDISIDRYVATYARLNIDFDEYSGESQVNKTTIERVESLLQEKSVYEQDNGSWVINFEKHGSKGLGVAVVRGRTGTTTYLLRDVAAVLDREEKYNFDKMIYVVSTEQDLYFRRVFRTLELMGRSDLAARLQHVNFGKVMGMSSRLGNVKLLSDILDQSREAMHEVMRRNAVKYSQVAEPDAVAEKVGISAVMVQDMSGKRINNYPFDINRMTSFEGDTGPYLQYCHARLNSILRKAGLTRKDLVNHLENHADGLDADILMDKPHAVDLLRLMAQYPDVTAMALKTLEPSTVLTYLFRLAHQLSSCYDVLQVVGAEGGRHVVLARAALYEGARQVLETGMRLLGLSPVER
ncbi:arginine--tRNA ligase [Chaetomidium leptoderma]|uniref:arginine--tRNA ligase n=1 Tax=Chaetomidium leptoderma TaxID=669021 RepID=A0AAN7A097_9PEZI|nr:arginine--tRNA ligase [Chaetomidium leptoderma]